MQRHAAALVLAAIVLLSLLFRLHVAHECSLWLDEAFTHAESERPWAEVLAGPEREHPPLMYVLVKLSFVLFGDSHSSLRVASLVAGCVLLVAVYWLCAELGFGSVQALVTVGLLAVTPFFLRNAVEARQYALYPAFGTLATAAALRLLSKPNELRFLAVFVVGAGAMAATHYFGFAYSLALTGALVVGLAPRWRALELTPRRATGVALGAGALLVVLGWILARACELARFYATQSKGDATMPWRELLASTLGQFAFAGDVPGLPLIEMLLAAAGLVLVARSLRGIARVLPAALTFFPCLLALGITSGHFVAPRYLALSWVIYHVGACAALFGLSDALRRATGKFARPLREVIAWSVFALPLGLRLAEYPEEFGAGEADYRGLATYFRGHLAADTALVTFPGSFGNRIMGREYPTGSPPISLEHFEPKRGVRRYLVAEIHASRRRQPLLESLIVKHFGISAAAWRALPLVNLPGTTYQPPVPARLITWDGKKAGAPAHALDRRRAPARRHGHRRRHRHVRPRKRDIGH